MGTQIAVSLYIYIYVCESVHAHAYIYIMRPLIYLRVDVYGYCPLLLLLSCWRSALLGHPAEPLQVRMAASGRGDRGFAPGEGRSYWTAAPGLGSVAYSRVQ